MMKALQPVFGWGKAVCLAVCLGLFVNVAAGQEASPSESGANGDVAAKNLFFAPEEFPPPPPPVPGVGVPPPGPTVVVPMGLKYRILVKDGDMLHQVTGRKTFRSGQQIRLILSPNVSGYLYIFEHGSKGTQRMIFPDPRINNGENFVHAWQDYELPSNGFLAFDETPGKEILHIFLSPVPVAEFVEIEIGAPQLPPLHWDIVRRMVNNLKSACQKNLFFADEPPVLIEQPVAVAVVPTVFVYQVTPVLHAAIILNHIR